nr:MAG TPA: hypothetical protein [Caudoviricetes sp.]
MIYLLCAGIPPAPICFLRHSYIVWSCCGGRCCSPALPTLSESVFPLESGKAWETAHPKPSHQPAHSPQRKEHSLHRPNRIVFSIMTLL